MPKHANATSFKPGNCANPKGAPKLTPERFEFKKAMESLLPKAWQRVSEMLEPGVDFEERRFAIQTVMDRVHGKVVERKEITGAGGGAIQIEDSTPAVRLLLQQALEHDGDKVIEGDVTEP